VGEKMSQLFDKNGRVLDSTNDAVELKKLGDMITGMIEIYLSHSRPEGADIRAIDSWLSSAVNEAVLGYILNNS
jgi:hypothetical protein